MTYLQNNADGIQTLLALIAAALGAFWWYSRREHLFRANLEAELEHIQYPGGSSLFRVIVNLENIGQRVITVEKLDIWVQKISPITEGFEFKYAENSNEYDWPFVAGGPIKYTEPQFFEPGERGSLVFDFRPLEVPSVVSVYVHVVNASARPFRFLHFGKRKRREIGWNTAKLIRIPNVPSPTAP